MTNIPELPSADELADARPDGLPRPPGQAGVEAPTRRQRGSTADGATRRQRDGQVGNVADPPTRYQRPDQEAADPATRLQPRSGGTGGSRPAASGPSAPPAAVLGELETRFEPVPGPDGTPRLGAGGEAEVWLVRDRELDRLAALKVYRPDPQLMPEEAFDTGLRERLADQALRAHVPELYGWGRARDGYGREVAWEAMEYFALGSLADLIRHEAPADGRLSLPRAEAVLREAVNALVFWEDVVKQRQIDLSPGNIMIRRADPLELVLSDFGGVRGTGLSQAIAPLQVKVGYMAPEALGNGNHTRSPYWSLGMICYQLVMGRSIISGRDEEAFRIILATDEIDVSAVPDPRWRLLIEGLLTRSPERRWGPDEVRLWLRGKAPAVQRSVRSDRTEQVLEFDGHPYADRRLLTAAMTKDATGAARWLQDGAAARLVAWLDTFEDRPFDPVHLAGAENDQTTADLAVSWLAAAFLPDQRPHFRGVPVDVDGMLRLSQDPGSRAFLHQVADSNVLRIAALHDCAHPECTRGHCRELYDLGDRISSAARQTMSRLEALSRRLAGDTLASLSVGTGPLVGQGDVDRCYSLAAEVLVSAERAALITATIRHSRLPRAAWWQDIARAALHADHRTAEGAAALCVAAELTDRAQAYRRAEDQRRRSANGQRVRSAFAWVGQQFTRNPSGRQRVFVTPRWMARVLYVLIPLASLEPVYRGIVYTSTHPLNQKVMQFAAQAANGTRAYTHWAPDFLTPWLLGHFTAERWKAYAVYPVVLLIALAVIRRSRGGSAFRSWLALPALIIGAVFGLGLIAHLLATSAYSIFADVGGLGVAVVIAPLLSLVAIRILGGRAQ
jgi:Protein kinase domain